MKLLGVSKQKIKPTIWIDPTNNKTYFYENRCDENSCIKLNQRLYAEFDLDSEFRDGEFQLSYCTKRVIINFLKDVLVGNIKHELDGSVKIKAELNFRQNNWQPINESDWKKVEKTFMPIGAFLKQHKIDGLKKLANLDK